MYQMYLLKEMVIKYKYYIHILYTHIIYIYKMNFIVDPTNLNKIPLSSYEGKMLLKKYIAYYQSGGARKLNLGNLRKKIGTSNTRTKYGINTSNRRTQPKLNKTSTRTRPKLNTTSTRTRPSLGISRTYKKHDV